MNVVQGTNTPEPFRTSEAATVQQHRSAHAMHILYKCCNIKPEQYTQSRQWFQLRADIQLEYKFSMVGSRVGTTNKHLLNKPLGELTAI